jgi:hypothetical protein
MEYGILFIESCGCHLKGVEMNFEKLKIELESAIEVATEKTIDYLIEKNVSSIPKKEYLKLEIGFDIYRCLGKYILESDEIEIFSIQKFPISVNLGITRDGIYHSFESEQIIASGSVQQAHYRYIAKTSLKKLTSSLPILLEIKEKKKKLNKIERVEKEIVYLEDVIKRCEKVVSEKENKTLEEIHAHTNTLEYHEECWDSKEDYDESIKKWKLNDIASNEAHITTYKNQIVDVKKSIVKQIKKLENLKVK